MFKKSQLLFAIIVLATILRLYQLGNYPISLFGDEVDAGYNAYSLLKTGKDYNGNLWPIHAQSMTDFRPAAYIYTLIPSIAIFGLSNFSVRLVPALLGILNIFLIYLVTYQFVSTSKLNQIPISGFLPLISALLLAITPWHIHLSRIAIEQTLYLSLLLVATYAFLKSKTHVYWLMLSSFTFALAAYTYHAAKLFSPLLLLILLIIYRKHLLKIPKVYLFLNILILILTVLPLLNDLYHGSGQNRFNSLTWYNHPKILDQINYQRGQISNLPSPLPRLLQNKFISYAQYWSQNYFMAFSPTYLFIAGDAQNPRHSIPGFGLFYWWMLPLFIIGLYFCLQNRKFHFSNFMLLWLVIAPIPSSLTIDGGHHAIRHFPMVIPIIIISSLGLLSLYQNLNHQLHRQLTIVLIVIFTFSSLTLYAQRYLFHYSPTYYQHWQYGLIPAIQKAEKIQDHYDQIIVTKSLINLPMLYYVFATQYDPVQLQNQFQLSTNSQTPPPTEQIKKYYFKTINPGDSYHPAHSLYISSPWDQHDNWYLIDKINSPDPMNDQPVLQLLQSEKPLKD